MLCGKNNTHNIISYKHFKTFWAVQEKVGHEKVKNKKQEITYYHYP